MHPKGASECVRTGFRATLRLRGLTLHLAFLREQPPESWGLLNLMTVVINSWYFFFIVVGHHHLGLMLSLRSQSCVLLFR